MSTQPPPGPPSGPLRPAPPPPAPARRPWWRSPAALTGAAAVVVTIAVVVALVVMRAGGDDGRRSSRFDSLADARALVKRVALTPEDWGVAFTRDSPYQAEDTTETFSDENCRLVRQRGVNVLTTLTRNIRSEDRSVSAFSSVTVYRDAGSAAATVARLRSDAERCREQTDVDGRTRWADIHTVDLPHMAKLDDVTAEEGRGVVDDKGQRTNTYYTYLNGHRGPVLLQVYVIREGTPGANRDDALNALSLMLSRV